MPTFPSNPRVRALYGLVAVAILAVPIAISAPRLRTLFARETPPAVPPNADARSVDAVAATRNDVTLPARKLALSRIELEPARIAELDETETVAGIVEPDPDLWVEIRPRVTGVVREIAINLGEQVNAGDLLAVLDSTEIGTARLDLRAKRRDLALALADFEWESVVANNVEALSDALDEEKSSSTLEREFAGRPIGDMRSMLLASYADLEAARAEEERQANLVRDRVVSAPKEAIARRARLSAQATFQAALEQVRYDARRTRLRAEQSVRMAEAAVADTRQRLELFGVDVEEPEPDDDPFDDPATGTEDLTSYRIHAPFDGTIASRTSIPSQRVEPTDVMMVLVDLTEVHAVAQVPESHFGFLPAVDETIAITASAYPGRQFEARVHSIGAEVDPLTRTIPIHTHVKNPDRALKLGMFLKMELTRRETSAMLSVPSSAVIEIEGRPGVFVPGEGSGTFAFRAIEAGPQFRDRRVVLSGIEAGVEVVSEGAFLLKSELILQNEPEEE